VGLFERTPQTRNCPLCGESILDESSLKREHMESHLFEVTDNNGLRAYAFNCPSHGGSDLAWGGGKEEALAKGTAISCILAHCNERHGLYIGDMSYWR
jgi:hypothetical protein